MEVSQVTEVPLNFNFDGSLIERTNGEKLLAVVHPVSLSLDLNTEICTALLSMNPLISIRNAKKTSTNCVHKRVVV